MFRSPLLKLLILAALVATVAPLGCSGGASCQAKSSAPITAPR